MAIINYSIIVPAFNTALYVDDCLYSIINAVIHYGNKVEVICVDDGSTDRTYDIIDSYTKCHFADNLIIKVIHKNNGGVGSARNCGLEIAQGEWILFVDSDDLLRESTLSDISSAVKRYPNVDFVVFNDIKFNDGDTPKWKESNNNVISETDLSCNIPSCLANVCIWGAAHRRETIKKIFFRDYVLGEDLVFFCEVMSHANKCSFIKKPEYANRLRSGSATRSVETYRKIYDRISYNEFMFKTISNSGKRFGSAFIHGRGNSWIEEIPSLILSWRNKKERDELFLKWCDSMSQATSMKFFSRWQRFVTKLVSLTKSNLIAWGLCVLPHKLKMCGFHR